MEADKFALSDLTGGERHNLASFVSNCPNDSAALVFYRRGPSPAMIVQSTRVGAGLIVYGAASQPRIALQGAEHAASVRLHDADARERIRLGSEPRAPTDDDPSLETELSLRLQGPDGAVQVELPPRSDPER
jgi:hypothetical protein